MLGSGSREARRGLARTGVPSGINVAAGCVVLVVAAFVAATVPASATAWRLVPVLGGLAGFAAATIDPPAVAAVVGTAFLIVNGFLVDRLGELSWHGTTDLWRLCALTLAGAAGLATGVVGRATRRQRHWREQVRRVERWANEASLMGDEEEERYV